MVNKGGFSFVAMLVINPIVILFYQNCSMTPISHAKNSQPPAQITRQIASEGKTATLDTHKKACQGKTEACTSKE
jgi:hypothetical protein